MQSMSRRAWVYVFVFYTAGSAIFLLSFALARPAPPDWLVFGVLLALAGLAQLFKAEAPNHQLYHPAYIFLFSAVLLLDPFYFNVIVIVAHLAEWLKERLLDSPYLRDWYIQPFNIAMHIFLGNAARLVYLQVVSDPGDLTSLAALAGAVLAALLYVFLNHLIIGTVIFLARQVSLRELEILKLENLATDFIMLLVGYAGAILISIDIWLILPAMAPLFLIYRALSVPQLQQRANTDPKTGLWNAEYFVNALKVEMARSDRFTRPLTVVMADIDLLRNINNTYGHLAGDAVLVGVASILKASFREYDIVARFGGEEFAVLIPETAPATALERIESVRSRIEASEFVSPTTRQRIKATMSFGVAGINGGKMETDELLHCADIAVYAAKLSGRNQTCLYTDRLRETLSI